jgi:hypothetical protein
MIGGLTTGIIVILALVALAIIFVGWLVTNLVLIGLFGWNLPGMVIGPAAHFVNTVIAVVLTLAVILATLAVLLRGYNIITF